MTERVNKSAASFPKSVPSPANKSTALDCSFLVLNVCGLMRRMRYDEFKSLITKHDICLLSETKTDDVDLDELQDMCGDIGYSIFLKNRSSYDKVRSGGLAVIVRNSLLNSVTVKKTECKYVQWLTFEPMLTKLRSRLLLGLVYIPPEGSKYVSESAFVELEAELLDLREEDDLVCLCGDFNARTKNMLDYVDFDELICGTVGIDENLISVIDPQSPLEAAGIARERCTRDLGRPNNYGYKLVEFCKSHTVYICNGRVGADHDKGLPTTRSGTLIDYVLGTCGVLKAISSFEVLDFDPLYSDVHAAISFTLGASSVGCDHQDPDRQYEEVAVNSKFFWDKRREGAFVDACLGEWVNKLVEQIDSGHIDSVDAITSQIVENFTIAARAVLKPKKSRPPLRKNHKPWFNSNCLEKRRLYRSAKRNYRIRKTIRDMEALTQAGKNYKHTMNKAMKEYNFETVQRLKKFKKANSKEFWRIMGGRGPRERCPVSLDEFFDHFKQMGNTQVDDGNPCELNLSQSDDSFNAVVTSDEIAKLINKLPNNKCAGADGILNEYIKSTAELLLPLYVRLFNLILDQGVVPREWLIGMVLPIYKGKGDKHSVDNYRGITLLSCLGKLFTSLLNSRLTEFCTTNEIILENQTGFRQGYSTLDHVFLLKNLIDMYLDQKKRLYCTFIDYRKAFDSVWRHGLWLKCLKSGIKGKILEVIKNMYGNIKSCITSNGRLSEFFECNVGVRQGENLSPLLFALYVNDLESYLLERNCEPVVISGQQTTVMLKLLLLLYADDTVILADTPEALQKALNSLSEYCNDWKLQINSSKTKVIVFSKRRLRSYPIFTFEGTVLDRVDNFKYLGIVFSYNGSFTACQKALVIQAQKAMYSILSKVRRLHLPIDLTFHLFDTVVVPILLYGSEIWACTKLDIIERLHLKWCKLLLQVKSSTPKCMLYGELGQFPLSIACKVKMTHFWANLLKGSTEKLSYKMYKFAYDKFASGGEGFPWVRFLKGVLDECGLSNVWLTQDFPSVKWVVSKVQMTLQDQFRQTWWSTVQESSKCMLYKEFKCNLKFERYLSQVPPYWRKYIIKLRLCNHRLAVERGRYANVPRHQRYCTLCNDTILGDEFHFLLQCPALRDLRTKFIPRFYRTHVNMLKFIDIMSCENVNLCVNIAKFIKAGFSRM